MVLQLPSREQMEFPSKSFGNGTGSSKVNPSVSACHQIHCHWWHKGGAQLPRMLGGAASSQSWEQHGITVCLGNVHLMGLGCGFMDGLGFWLLVRNPEQRSLFPESHSSEGVRNINQRSLFPDSHNAEGVRNPNRIPFPRISQSRAELQQMFSSGITLILLTQSRDKTKGLGEKIFP